MRGRPGNRAASSHVRVAWHVCRIEPGSKHPTNVNAS